VDARNLGALVDDLVLVAVVARLARAAARRTLHQLARQSARGTRRRPSAGQPASGAAGAERE
jgi:hypothetical protein